MAAGHTSTGPIVDVVVESSGDVDQAPRLCVVVDGVVVFDGLGREACEVGSDVANAFLSHQRTGMSVEQALDVEGRPLPCECGCGMVLPGGHLERAHPEDYRYDER